ncbi:hypothetical protein BV25DRAFT_1990642 [Artomyces pyxidatus]|uniref:Uncharacterized protein n=1 Tax=Artomyces pyxidatus TaxID=48021 RepID=A0ACB8T6B9_9AGAM|nr:hypothetical protein BV25DRAFT_1990642 [Artomyces pyxidatus]
MLDLNPPGSHALWEQSHVPGIHTTPDPLVWLIVGCWFVRLSISSMSFEDCLILELLEFSSRLARDLALEALSRGDKVIVTARACSMTKLDRLSLHGADTLELDVAASSEMLHDVASRAAMLYGCIDILVNDMAQHQVGASEERTAQNAFDQQSNRLLGSLDAARAFLPYVRSRQFGAVIWLSPPARRAQTSTQLQSADAISTTGPIANPSTQDESRMHRGAFHQKISPQGLRSIVVEPGYSRTPRKPRRGDPRLDLTSSVAPGNPADFIPIVVDAIRREGRWCY